MTIRPADQVDIWSPDRSIRMTVGLRGPTAIHLDSLTLRRRGYGWVADAIVTLAAQAIDRLRSDHIEWVHRAHPAPAPIHQLVGRRAAVSAAATAVRERLDAHPAFADDHHRTMTTSDGLIAVTSTADRPSRITIDPGADRRYSRHRYPAPLLAEAIVSLARQATDAIAAERRRAIEEILATELGRPT